METLLPSGTAQTVKADLYVANNSLSTAISNICSQTNQLTEILDALRADIDHLADRVTALEDRRRNLRQAVADVNQAKEENDHGCDQQDPA